MLLYLENNTLKYLYKLNVIGKIQVQFLRLGTLGSSIDFKHMVALTNEIQTMLSLSRIFKFNVFEFNQKLNVLFFFLYIKT